MIGCPNIFRHLFSDNQRNINIVGIYCKLIDYADVELVNTLENTQSVL